ncbi:MAG: ASCH domain-containing protein [Mobilitalea sp.]
MDHKSVLAMWKEYLTTIGEDEENTLKSYTSWHFCDNEEDANDLAELVLLGTKRATASLYLSYEYEKEDLPKIGKHSIIMDWSNDARCILETIKIDIVPYQEVTESFAATEGEGDKSLDYWRRAHWSYFSREMEAMGSEASEDMLVVCEEFKVVYKK